MELKELLEKLGIAADKQDSATAAIKSYLDGAYVTKSRFNEVNEEKKTLQVSLSDRDKQLEILKKSTGDTESLKKQIKDLQEKNKADAEAAEVKMKDLRMNTAIKLAIGNNAQDTDIVAGLIDKNKLILGEDGKVTGLDEQVKALQTSKPFLFKAAGHQGYNPQGGTGAAAKNPFAKDTWNMTEQGNLYRSNPEEAKAMAAAAGVTI